MKKITSIFLSMVVAASLVGFSTSASACGCARHYYYHTEYVNTCCGCKRVVYRVPCCNYVPTCCRHETPCRSCGCGGFFGLF